MAWDSTRPVPWARFVKQWMMYAVVMVAFMLIFARDRNLTGVFLGLAASLPIYLAFGGILAKFGYTPKSLKELRSASTTAAAERSAASTPQRPKPAPTKRTNAGRRR